MRWRVDAIIVDIIEADTADEASAWFMNQLADKWGSEFLNSAIIRTQPALMQDEYHDSEGQYLG